MRAADGRLGGVLTGSRKRPREKQALGSWREDTVWNTATRGRVRRIVMTPVNVYRGESCKATLGSSKSGE